MAGDSSSTPAPKGGGGTGGKSSGGFLMAKIGPFPVIVYLIVAGVAVYVLVQKKKSAAKYFPGIILFVFLFTNKVVNFLIIMRMPLRTL